MSKRRFVRVSTPTGHHSVPVETAERAGSKWTVLKQDAVDAKGRPLPSKPREEIAAERPVKKKRARKATSPEPRGTNAAATPTKPEASVSVDTPEE